MARYINVENFIKEKRELYCIDCNRRKGMSTDEIVYEIGDAPCSSCGINDILEDIEDYLTVDVQEVKHGHWIDTTTYCGEFTCSICKEMCVTNKYKYCPHCGAKMDKEEN